MLRDTLGGLIVLKVAKLVCFAVGFVFILFIFAGCDVSTNDLGDTNSGSVQNNEAAEDNYQFDIVEDVVRLVYHKDSDAQVIIVPETISGKPVKILGREAFYQHTKTTSIQLPENLTTIEGSSFYRCYSLQQICIPKNVREINANPFFRCSSLSFISVDTQNDYYSSVDGILFNHDQTVLIAYPEGNDNESYTIPSSVVQLDLDSFGYHTALKTLTIPSSVVSFPEGNMFVFPDDILLVVESGSVAETYAKKHNLRHEILK